MLGCSRTNYPILNSGNRQRWYQGCIPYWESFELAATAQIDYLPPGGTDPFLLGSHKPTTDGGEDVYCFIGFMEEAGAGAVGFGVVDVHMPALAEDRTHTTEYVLMYSVECLTLMFRVHRTLY